MLAVHQMVFITFNHSITREGGVSTNTINHSIHFISHRIVIDLIRNQVAWMKLTKSSTFMRCPSIPRCWTIAFSRATNGALVRTLIPVGDEVLNPKAEAAPRLRVTAMIEGVNFIIVSYFL